jgi:hypothetical protein
MSGMDDVDRIWPDREPPFKFPPATAETIFDAANKQGATFGEFLMMAEESMGHPLEDWEDCPFCQCQEQEDEDVAHWVTTARLSSGRLEEDPDALEAAEQAAADLSYSEFIADQFE